MSHVMRKKKVLQTFYQISLSMCIWYRFGDVQSPVVQSLTSSLVVKMLTALVNTVSNSLVFLLKKCE